MTKMFDITKCGLAAMPLVLGTSFRGFESHHLDLLWLLRGLGESGHSACLGRKRFRKFESCSPDLFS